MDEYTNYLVHHGIKGQRWGVRRYQNPDGSLTPAGRRKYGVKPSNKEQLGPIKGVSARDIRKANKYIREGTPVYWEGKRFGRKKLVRDKERIREIDQAYNNNPKNFSDEELKKRTERMRLENNYLEQINNLAAKYQKPSKSQKSFGEQVVDNLDLLQRGANNLSKFKDAYDKLSGKEKPLTEKEQIDLANSRVNLENSLANLENTKLNARKARVLLNKSRYDFNKTIENDDIQNDIRRAKSETISRVKMVSDEDLNRWTERHQKENDFLDQVFKQYNNRL